MKRYLGHQKARLAFALTSVVGASAIGLLVAAPPAAAAGLTNVTFNVSNNAANVGAAGNTADYTWGFTTSTTNTPTSMTFTVPTAASGTPTITVYGMTCTSATAAAISSGSFTITLSGCPTLSAATPMEVVAAGITNGTQTGSFSSSATVNYSSGGPDTGTASTTFSNNTTAVTVFVPESLTFTNNTSSIALFPTPNAIATAPVSLAVSTNANGGYELSACAAALTGTNSHHALTNVGASSTISAGTEDWGVEVTAPVSGGSITYGTNYASGKYGPYPTTCASGAANDLFSDSGPTLNDTITLTNAAAISAVTPADDYTTTINYLVTPHY